MTRRAGTEKFEQEVGVRRNVRLAVGIPMFIGIVVGLRVAQYYGFTRHLPTGALARPMGFLLEELIRAAIVLLATFALARFESRQATDYGLGGAQRTRLLLQGSCWGFGAISILIGAQWLSGNIGLTLLNEDALSRAMNGLLWLAAFFAVALFEEALLRGYLQHALTQGIGFWWSALVWSAAFMWMHSGNENESVLGLAQTGVIAMFFCLALKVTGSLWWPIGFHALWDWGESYFYGVANSGLLFNGRLMTAAPKGDALWSGGPGGPEASLWAFFVLALPTVALLRSRGRQRLALS